MSSKKKYEFRARERNFNRNSDGLKQRRLKDESRWKYNPSQAITEQEDLEEADWFQDPEYDRNPPR